MKLRVVAFYACGHKPRAIIEGKYAELAELINKATTNGQVVTECATCNRGCARLELWVNGKLVSTQSSDEFRAMIGKPGAVVSIAPDPKNN